MLTRATPEDWLAIFKKLNPESLANVYRSSKEAQIFMDINAKKIGVHVNKDFILDRDEVKGSTDTNPIYEVKAMVSTQNGDLALFKTKAGREFPENLRTLLADPSLQLFKFHTICLEGDLQYVGNPNLEEEYLKGGRLMVQAPLECRIPEKFNKFIFNDIAGFIDSEVFARLEEVSHTQVFADSDGESWGDAVVLFFEALQKLIRGELRTTSLLLTIFSPTKLDEGLNSFLSKTPHEVCHIAESLVYYLFLLTDRTFVVLTEALVDDGNGMRYFLSWYSIDSEETFKKCLKESFKYFYDADLEMDEILAFPTVDALRRRFFP